MQVAAVSVCGTVVTVMLKLHSCDLLWIRCATSCATSYATNPQQIARMEFEHYSEFSGSAAELANV